MATLIQVSNRSKWQVYTIYGLMGLLTLAFVLSGGTKLVGADMHVQNFTNWGYPLWFMYITGLVEIKVKEKRPVALVKLKNLHYLDNKGNVLEKIRWDDSKALWDKVVLTGPWEKSTGLSSVTTKWRTEFLEALEPASVQTTWPDFFCATNLSRNSMAVSCARPSMATDAFCVPAVWMVSFPNPYFRCSGPCETSAC